jgi:hypothetical protein
MCKADYNDVNPLVSCSHRSGTWVRKFCATTFSLGAINMDKKFKILFGFDVNHKSNPSTRTSIVQEDRTTPIPVQNSTSHTNIP